MILTSVVAIAAALIAGCGGGSSPGVASVGSSTSTSSSTSSSASSSPTEAQLQQAQKDMVKFVACAHSHGAPNLPDPTTDPHAFKNAFSSTSPGFQQALTACAHLLPAGSRTSQNPARTQAQTVALLAFAHCMRSHGFPSFPDPTSGGELTHQMLATAGIDLHEAAVVAAADGCTSVTHGVITKAIVANFVAGH